MFLPLFSCERASPLLPRMKSRPPTTPLDGRAARFCEGACLRPLPGAHLLSYQPPCRAVNTCARFFYEPPVLPASARRSGEALKGGPVFQGAAPSPGRSSILPSSLAICQALGWAGPATFLPPRTELAAGASIVHRRGCGLEGAEPAMQATSRILTSSLATCQPPHRSFPQPISAKTRPRLRQRTPPPQCGHRARMDGTEGCGD